MKKNLYLTILLCFGVLQVWAQNTVSGRITDASENVPLQASASCSKARQLEPQPTRMADSALRRRPKVEHLSSPTLAISRRKWK